MVKRFCSIATALFSAGLCAIAFSAKADPLGELRFITENYAPFNYEKNGLVQGSSIDLLLRIFDEAGTERNIEDIEVMNWARGYQMAQDTPNTVLFSTTRTEMRETMFKWVGPISPTRVVIIGKKDSGFSLTDVQDLSQFRIGAVRDDIGELLLLGAGIAETNIYRTNSSETTAKMLIADRIDLWAYEESVALFNLKEQGEDPADYEVLLELEQAELYFAIQKDTDDAVIAQLQDALNRVITKAETE